MSHFSVLVIGDNPEKQLAPYQENNMGDCPEEYLEFTEDEDCEQDEKAGKKGYWENPNKKWDWYELGGRYRNRLLLKSGERVDQAIKSEIDFEAICNKAEADAICDYESIERIFGGIPKIEVSWDTILNEKEDRFKGLTIEQKRNFYHNQEAMLKLKSVRDSESLAEKDKKTLVWLDLSDYQISKEEYVKNAREAAFTSFAVVKESKWYERGEMGWWACVSNEKDKDVWNREFKSLIDSIPDDALISMYDCHI